MSPSMMVMSLIADMSNLSVTGPAVLTGVSMSPATIVKPLVPSSGIVNANVPSTLPCASLPVLPSECDSCEL